MKREPINKEKEQEPPLWEMMVALPFMCMAIVVLKILDLREKKNHQISD